MIKVVIGIMLLASSANAITLEDQVSKDQDDSSSIETITLKPNIIVSKVSSNIQPIQLDQIKPYLEQMFMVENPILKKPKKKLTKGITSTVQATKDLGINTETSRYVVSFQNNTRTMVGAQDNVFVKGISKDSHIKYFLVRPTLSFYHPNTKEYLGTGILVIGKGTLLERDDFSLLKIESAHEPIKLGTLVLPSRSLDLVKEINTFYADQKLHGYVLSIIPGLVYAATNSVVVVSLGSRDGIKVGQLLDVKSADQIVPDPYDSKKKHFIVNKDPKAQIVIYDVFNKLSLGLALKVYEEIRILDQIVS